jgi:hypothetical protein
MSNKLASISAQRYARICGILYMYIIVAGIFMGLFVRPALVVPGDAGRTATQILAGESLFRLGISAELLQVASDVAVAMLLYVLFRPVNRGIALLAAFMRLVADIILGMASLLHFVALRLVGASTYLDVFTVDQTQAFALFAMNLHNDGYAICLFFFGFALVALGYVIYRAPYFPTLIGVLLAVAGGCYLINSFAYFLEPALAASLAPAIYVPMFIGEFALAVWLLIKGVNTARWQETTSTRRQFAARENSVVGSLYCKSL